MKNKTMLKICAAAVLSLTVGVASADYSGVKGDVQTNSSGTAVVGYQPEVGAYWADKTTNGAVSASDTTPQNATPVKPTGTTVATVVNKAYSTAQQNLTNRNQDKTDEISPGTPKKNDLHK